MNDINQKLKAILPEENIVRNEPLAKHTTFKIGGPAEYFVTPENEDQLKLVIKVCKESNIPYYIIGKGSNLLVGDKGYKGVIIQIYKNFDLIKIDKNIVTAGAGVMLSRLATQAAEHNLAGLQGECGIPGTLGGAVTMNAGAYGYEIKDYIISATVLNQEGEIFTLNKEELQLAYRTSIIQKNSYIVIEAVFELPYGNKEDILAEIAEFNRKRVEKQPLEYPSAGSTFKRPVGYFAGKLIMDSGLAGYRVGDIMISMKHCGFVVNVGNGTASEVRQLIEDVQHIVYEKHQVMLEPEVRIIGEF
ncbi:UDP-N-acetylmuramate dehydrogenase [Anaerosporobacter sp.]|uniref:UDP-N-acetylmuramate dehydrogenase n=1 Tax=Anaerosporobacter sp. TaxID=1872529 RepID=UPI00289CE56A|nr:UDP-N-acetylmuramate dehydrogenase [Anaerosporobacter sp.]